MTSRGTFSTPVDGGPAPAVGVAVRVVVLAVREAGLRVLLHSDEQGPELPGVPLDPATSLDDARDLVLARHLGRAAGAHVEQLGTFGPRLGRDQVRVVTVAYLALVHVPEGVEPSGSTCWAPVDAVPAGATTAVVTAAVDRARARLGHTSAGLALCAPVFTVGELRQVYEAVWGCAVGPRNFHRKVVDAPGFLQDTGQRAAGGPGRPAVLYRRGGAEVLHPPLRRG